MSRSRPNTVTKNPAKRYFEWSGSEGKLSFYDKEAKENVLFPKLNFLLLEGDLHTVVGYSKKHKNGIRGSEVRDIKSNMDLYVGKNKIKTAPYSELKSFTGVKYAKPLYIAMPKKDGSMEIVKLTLKGAAFSAWVNFLRGQEDYAGQGEIDPYTTGIRIVGPSVMKKNGSTEYYEPKFETYDVSEEEDQMAAQLDSQLQEYLDARLPKAAVETEEEEEEVSDEEPTQSIAEEHSDAEDVDDLPF